MRKLYEYTTMMEALRKEQRLTRSELARKAEMQPTVITWIETGRFIPYDTQLEKIAVVLGWKSDIHKLIEEAE